MTSLLGDLINFVVFFTVLCCHNTGTESKRERLSSPIEGRLPYCVKFAEDWEIFVVSENFVIKKKSDAF